MSASDSDVAPTKRPNESAPEAATSRYARKQQAIIAAASEILNRDGVKGMTLANVAQRVGLITTSVTYYFKKKEDLAVACFLDAIARFDTFVSAALRAPDPPSRIKRLLELWLDLRKGIEAGESPPVAYLSDIRALQKPHRTLVAETYMRFFQKVRALFESPDYPWLDDTLRSARAHILAEQVFWAVAWLRRYETEDYERVGERIYDILLHGLALPGRQWVPRSLPLADVLPTFSEEPSSRETFLIAATRLINERGYRGASVEKISERLNVTKGSFYHHNEAKDDLVVDCFKRTFETMRRIVRAGLDQRPPGDHWQQITTIALTLMAYQRSDRGPLLRTSALVALPGPIRDAMIDTYGRVAGRLAGIIIDGITAGSVRAVDPFVASMMLSATLNASAEYKWWVPGAQPTDVDNLYVKPLLMGLFSR